MRRTLTPEHQRHAAAGRAATFDKAFHQAGGRAAGAIAAGKPGWLQELGRRGAAATRARFGHAFLMQCMAAKKRSQAPDEVEQGVLALLARWGLVEGEHYERNFVVTVPGQDGRLHDYEIDLAITGQLDLEIDGGVHALPGRAAHDARRDADLTAAGWTVRRIDATQCPGPNRLRVIILGWLIETGGFPRYAPPTDEASRGE